MSHPYYVRIPQIDLEKVVTFIETKEVMGSDLDPGLDDVLEAQHNRPFVLEKPLLPFWRIVVQSSTIDRTRFVIAFIFHHCLADGQSGVEFHRWLADVLCHLPIAKLESIIDSPKTPMVLQLERLHKSSSTDGQPNSTGHASSPSDPVRNLWAGEKQTLPVRSRFRSMHVSNEMSDKLVAQCRANGTSVTATMQTLIAASLFSFLPENVTSVNFDCAISLRRWLH